MTKLSATVERILLFSLATVALVVWFLGGIDLGDFLIVIMTYFGFSLLIMKIVEVANKDE